MSDLPGATLAVERVPAAAPQIEGQLWQLVAARERLKQVLHNLPDAAVDWEPPAGQNQIGTLLYHIAAIEMSWLYVDVLQSTFPGAVAELMRYPVRDDQGRLTVVSGVSLEEHLACLDITRAHLLAAYRNMGLEDYYRSRRLDGYSVTPEWVLFHLMLHETEHRGELQTLLTQFSCLAQAH